MIRLIYFISFLLCFNISLSAIDLDSALQSVAHLPKTDTNRLSEEATIAWMMMDVNLEKSLKMCLEGNEHAKSIQHNKLQYQFLVTAATAYQMKLDFPKSIEYYKKAIAISQKEKKDRWLVNAYGNLANTYFKMNDFQNCIETNLIAIEIAKKSSEPLMWGNCYITNAGCSAMMKDTTISIKYTKLALEDPMLTPPHIVNAYSNLANMYLLIPRLDSAKKYLNLLESYIRKYNMNDDPTIKIKEHLALIEYDFAQKIYTPKTKKNITELLDYSMTIEDTISISWAYKFMAIYFSRKKEYDSSNFFALKAAGYMSKAKDFYNHAQVLDLLKSNYSSQGNWKEALRYANMEKDVVDSFNMLNNADAVRNAEIRFDTRHKEERNNLLTRENKVKTKEKNIVLVGGLSLAGLLSFLLWFVIRSRNKTRQLNIKIEEQNRDLEESNATKDKIFRIISHDLRAPIANLSSLIQFKESASISDENLKELDNDIKSSLQNTSAEMDNLLIWSIGQLKNEKSNDEEFELNELVQSQIDLLKPQCKAKNIEVKFQANSKYNLKNDKNGVAVVFRNILNNAIKFSHINSSIEVKLIKLPAGKFSISVKDEGIGMSKNQIDQYQQGIMHSSKGTSSELGTGLGFLIIKDYCKKMNAQLDIESEEGKGSLFVFTF